MRKHFILLLFLIMLFPIKLCAYKFQLPNDIFQKLKKEEIYSQSIALSSKAVIQKLYKKCLRKLPPELKPTAYISIVVVSEQKNYIFYQGKLIFQTIVSTGSKTRYKGDRTMPDAIWRLGQRIDKDLIPLYGPRLIYMEKYNEKLNKFTKTKKAFHGTKEPFNLGKPTSMGCVYHHNDVIRKLYDLLPDHTFVFTVNSI